MFELGKTDHWWEIAKRHPSLSNHPNTLKPLGYAHIVNLIESFKPKRVLEVGHGAMSFIFKLFADKIEMWGLDDVIEDSSVYEEDLNNVRKWNPQVTFVRDLLGRFSTELPENYFDLVYSVSVIEHIPHEILPEVFKDTYRILKPGGIVSHSYDVYYKQSTKEVFNAYENAGFKWLKPKNTMNVFWEDWLDVKNKENLTDDLFEKIVFENPIEVAEKYMWQQDRKYRNSPINFVTVLNAAVKPEKSVEEPASAEKTTDEIKISECNVGDFTYSKRSFMESLIEKNIDEMLYGKKINMDDCDIKIYQNLLIYLYVRDNLKPDSKILEIGNNPSQVLQFFKKEHQCYLMKLGENDVAAVTEGIETIDNYLDNAEVNRNEFDFVFSVSGFGQEISADFEGYKRKLDNINYLLKPGGYSMFTFVLLYQDPLIWKPEILEYFFSNQHTLNEYIPMMKVLVDEDLYTMSEKYYKKNWEKYTSKSYYKFGKPLSYNIFWKKD
ncbi:MAG: hypothetical protein HGGPFJEG_00931 [Ignavibacteria bacterium]|nr:hypothetical protein [Ignavibacteria bacterium]